MMNIDIVDPYLVYDEEAKQLGVNWGGVNALGITYLPYELGLNYTNGSTEYPRILFDLAEKESETYSIYVKQSDTGRIIRGQIVNEGVGYNCTDSTLYWEVRDKGNNKIISKTSIDAFTDIVNGFFEIALTSTVTAQDCIIYFWLDNYEFNKIIYIYVDYEVKEENLIPVLKIRKGSYDKKLYFRFYDYNNEALDNTFIKSATIYFKQYKGILILYYNLTKNKDNFEITLPSTLTSDYRTYYFYIVLTLYTDKIITLPTYGYMKAEVY